MIELTYRFTNADISKEIVVRLFDVKQARGSDDPAPWAISVTILWGEEVAFDRPLAGVDPLHAVELAAQYAANYIRRRAEDLGGTLDPLIPSA